jgi:DNA-directed RNA polymerase subunit alpha
MFNDDALPMRQLLKVKLVDLDVPVRALNCLKSWDIYTLYDLVPYKRNEILKCRNLGKKTLTQLDELLENIGLNFGMDLKEYYTDEELNSNNKKF